MKNTSTDTIHERISLIIKHFGLNNNSFARKIGLSSATIINNITGGRFSKPSFDLMNLILEAFPDINGTWLISGRDKMLNQNNIQMNTKEPETKKEPCSQCEHKQEIIDLQKGRIESLTKVIESKDELLNVYRSANESNSNGFLAHSG